MKLANIWYKVLIFVITYHKVFFTSQYQSFCCSKMSLFFPPLSSNVYYNHRQNVYEMLEKRNKVLNMHSKQTLYYLSFNLSTFSKQYIFTGQHMKKEVSYQCSSVIFFNKIHFINVTAIHFISCHYSTILCPKKV